MIQLQKKTPFLPSSNSPTEAVHMFYSRLFGGVKREKRPVYGADIVISEFYSSLPKYSKLKYCFVTPSMEKQIAPFFKNDSISQINLDEFFETKNLPSVWHDMSSDLTAKSFQLRENNSGNYPITITHNTVSHSSMLYSWFLRFLLAGFRPYDAIICTSHSTRTAIDYLLKYVAQQFNAVHKTDLKFTGRLELIPLGVDTNIFIPGNQNYSRKQLGLPQEAFIILWAGRFSGRNKADLLPFFPVFKSLLKKHSRKKLFFLLAGTDFENESYLYENFAKSLGINNKVIIRSNLDPKSRHLVHSAADIFISPIDNIQESFGITPIEAMACGVPQVVSDWDGYKDTVVDNVTGFRIPTLWAKTDREIALKSFFTPNMGDHLALSQSVSVDMEEMEKALSRLIESPSLRKRMGEASRKRAVDLFSWQSIFKKYEELWKELQEISNSDKFSYPPFLKYQIPPYFDAFKNYATKILDDKTRLTISHSANELFNTNNDVSFPLIYDQLGFKLEVFLAIIGIIKNSEGGLTPKDLNQKEFGVNKEELIQHIMWLLKYGYLKAKL